MALQGNGDVLTHRTVTIVVAMHCMIPCNYNTTTTTSSTMAKSAATQTHNETEMSKRQHPIESSEMLAARRRHRFFFFFFFFFSFSAEADRIKQILRECATVDEVNKNGLYHNLFHCTVSRASAHWVVSVWLGVCRPAANRSHIVCRCAACRSWDRWNDDDENMTITAINNPVN